MRARTVETCVYSLLLYWIDAKPEKRVPKSESAESDPVIWQMQLASLPEDDW